MKTIRPFWFIYFYLLLSIFESIITSTAHKHKDITDSLPAAHALSGCDTTSYLYGIGKATVLKWAGSGISLQLLGMEDVDMDEVVSEATSFISTCYGSRYVTYQRYGMLFSQQRCQTLRLPVLPNASQMLSLSMSIELTIRLWCGRQHSQVHHLYQLILLWMDCKWW